MKLADAWILLAVAAWPAGMAEGRGPASPPGERRSERQDPEKQGEPLPPAPPLQGPPAPKPLPPPPVLDYGVPLGLAAYEAALGRLAEAYPDLLRVKSLGKSRGGREIWLAIAFDPRAGEAGKMPAAAVVTDLAPLGEETEAEDGGSAAPPRHETIAGPQAVLYALANLLERARADEGMRAKLSRCALYFLPAPDPDGAFAGAEADAAIARTCRLDRNFPAGWDPFEEDRGGSGPYPLSEPESRMLARFLIDRTNLSALVMMCGPGRLPVDGSAGKDGAAAEGADAASVGAGSATVGTGSALGGGKNLPGSLEAYGREVVGTEVTLCEPWTGDVRASPVGNAPEGFAAAAARVEMLLDDLPRLQCGAPKVERLRADLWLVDLTLANAGKQPSSRAFGTEGGAQGVGMKTEGARAVSCALRRGKNGTFEPVRGGPQSWTLEGLDGGETVAVRLVVQGEEGANVAVLFESPRAGRARVASELK